MPLLSLISFAVFFICCASQFWFIAQVRNALIDRHPETFLEVERSSIFPQRGLMRFVWRSGYRALDDPALARHVRNLRLVYVLAIVAWLGILGGILIAGIFTHR